jgi:protein-S-isoprenylcysteine O-methyltransferase Ste14
MYARLYNRKGEEEMNSNAPVQVSNKAEIARGVAQRGLQVLAVLVIYGLVLFVSAGRLDWLAAWVYLGLYAAMIVVNMSLILPKNPEMIAERGKARADGKSWDKQLTGLAGVFMLAGLAVPGLDLRFQWSPDLALAVPLAGIAMLALGDALFSWALISNEFFETGVRIQKERGQMVATSGPYRYVRHPGYVGMILQLLGTPLLLGSVYGLIPAAIAAALFVLRTALEDRTLQNELAGYADYARRVRYRLLPGVW